MIVDLFPWEYERVNQVGIGRFTANWSKQDAKHYDPARMEDNRTAQVAAAACECAVARHTNRYWHGHVWHASDHHLYREMPDVGRNIEVRRVRTGTVVAVRQSDLGKGRVLWAARAIPAEFRKVELYGWMFADEAWDIGTPSAYAPETTRVVPLERLTLK